MFGRTGKMNISLSPFAPENLVSRDGFGSLLPRRPAHLHTQAEFGAYLLRDSSRVPRRRPFICFNRHTPSIGSVPSVSGHAIAYHDVHCRESVVTGPVSKPQSSSKRVLPWLVTMCVCVCFLPIHSGHQRTYQAGSHRRKVTQDFSSTFFLRCMP